MTEDLRPAPLKLLLVEDHPGDARVLIEQFREGSPDGAQIRHVQRISDALSTLEEEDYDVVLLDLSLPDGFGIAMVQRVRATAPHVPIVVLTGAGDENTAIEAVHEGAQDYLVKPEIDAAGLVRSVRNAIGRQKRMRRIAYYDGLTDLPNRSLFRDRLAQALTRGQRYGDRSALMFVDLDHFKRINDTFGHETGDAVLRVVAERMRECLRTSDVVARYGGDEFTVLLPCLPRYEEAGLVAEKLRARIASAHEIDGNDVSVSASIGVAIAPLDGSDIDALLERADAAMYRAKRQGKNRVVLATPMSVFPRSLGAEQLTTSS